MASGLEPDLQLQRLRPGIIDYLVLAAAFDAVAHCACERGGEKLPVPSGQSPLARVGVLNPHGRDHARAADVQRQDAELLYRAKSTPDFV